VNYEKKPQYGSRILTGRKKKKRESIERKRPTGEKGRKRNLGPFKKSEEKKEGKAQSTSSNTSKGVNFHLPKKKEKNRKIRDRTMIDPGRETVTETAPANRIRVRGKKKRHLAGSGKL